MLKNFKMEIFLKELENLVNFNHGSCLKEGTADIADYFCEKFCALGWKVKRTNVSSEVDPCIQFTNNSEEKFDVLLLGHMDTRFPYDVVGETPFSIRGNRAYGAGVYDMKTSLLFTYFAIKDLQERGRLHNISICIVFCSDEEFNSVYSRPLIEELTQKTQYALAIESVLKGSDKAKQQQSVVSNKLCAKGIDTNANINLNGSGDSIFEWIDSSDKHKTKFKVLRGMGPIGAYAYTVNEYVEINTLPLRLKSMVETIDYLIHLLIRNKCGTNSIMSW